MTKYQSSSFTNLIVWRKSMDVARLSYALASKLPKEEQFALASQIRRSAVSIPSNIAEGAKRGSKKEFKQFLRIAAGSAAELETQLILARDLYATHPENALSLLNEVERMIESLSQKF